MSVQSATSERNGLPSIAALGAVALGFFIRGELHGSSESCTQCTWAHMGNLVRLNRASPRFSSGAVSLCDWRISHSLCGIPALHESRNHGDRLWPEPGLPWRQAGRPEGLHQVACASLLGPFLACVRIHIALMGPVVRLRVVGVGGVVWRYVGTAFGYMAAHGVAASTAVAMAVALGQDG